MHEVRRSDDDELCGFVDHDNGTWRARNVFCAVLSEHGTEADARQRVLVEGLSSLLDRWTLVERATGDEEVACIIEASPVEVTVARDFYPLPGAPRLRISAAQLESGEWELRR